MSDEKAPTTYEMLVGGPSMVEEIMPRQELTAQELAAYNRVTNTAFPFKRAIDALLLMQPGIDCFNVSSPNVDITINRGPDGTFQVTFK